jgi:steroid delta-isomerase-like uncharacterized protein
VTIAKEVVDRGLAAWRARDADAFAQCYGDDAEIVGPGGMLLRGQEGARQFFAGWMEAVPDNEVTIQTEYWTDSAVFQEAVFSGTHTGNLVSPDGQVIPPTGRRVSAPFADIFVVERDRIQSDHIYFDQVEFLTQLGLMPTATASGGN